jgi:hypothetical protein
MIRFFENKVDSFIKSIPEKSEVISQDDRFQKRKLLLF